MSQIDTNIPRSAYIHIPFCRSRCYYCDFPISVLGKKTNIHASSSIQEYTDTLCQEILVTPAYKQPLNTVFFGGGTPSLLPVKQLERILSTLDKHLGISSNAEISMEIDPGTFTLEQLQGYQKAGVNRVSLGVQAFQEELLQSCGRSHTVQDIYASVSLIQKINLENYSLDLISGLPKQTLEDCEYSLKQATALSPKHLSCYDLVLEPVTAFGKQYQPGKYPLPNDETAAEMYRLTQQILTEAGYDHYEISNYAKPGYQCLHNRVYWKNKPYYGFGMGAASYTNLQRFTRPGTRQDYYTWVKELAESGGVIDCSKLSKTDILLETLMLGLRLAEGVNLQQIRALFNDKTVQTIWTSLQPYFSNNLVGVTDIFGNSPDANKIVNFEKINRIYLSDPEGFLFSNTILASLFEKFS